MEAYLEPARGNPNNALSRAIAGFRRREGRLPTWAAAGPGVTIDRAIITGLGLREQHTTIVRAGHVMVGTGTVIERKEAASPPA